MVSDNVNLEMADASTRRLKAEADANYIAQTQANARLTKETKYVNMDTGEVSYGKPFDNSPPVATATVAADAGSRPVGAAGDTEAGARHVKIAITFVLVVILTWAWIAQRRAAARDANR